MRYIFTVCALLLAGCASDVSRGVSSESLGERPSCLSGAPSCPDGLLPSCAEDCAQAPVCARYGVSTLDGERAACVREYPDGTRVYSAAVCIPGC